MSADKYLRALLKGPALAALALLMVLGAQASGLTSAIDRVLRGHYYSLEDPRESGQRVLLVAAGTETVRDWGPPPWSAERFDELQAEIDAGGPTIVALAGGERLFEFDDEQAPIPTLAPSLRENWAGTVEALALDSGIDGRRSVRELLSLTPLMPPPGEQLDIHYLTPTESLPRVDAHRVAAGDIPPSTFAGRVVLLGLTADPFAVPLPTPAGNMKLAEIHAHALLSLADRANWRAPGPAAALFWLAMLGLGSFAGRRLEVVPSLGVCGVGVAGILAVDYLLFSNSLMLMGASAPSLALLAACAAQLVERQVRTTQTLSELSKAVKDDLPVPEPTTAEEWEDFWLDLVSLGRSYVDNPHSAIIAELPENSWHLVIRACDGTSEAEIQERRRDIRRSPFRAGYLSHRAGWDDDFIRGGDKSLVVPLLDGGKIYGFWMLNVHPQVDLDEEELTAIEKIGRQMAQTIAGRRVRDGQLDEPEAGDVSGTMRVLRQGIETLSHSKDWARALAEQLPVGLMVASIFGNIEFQNEAMQAHLELDFPEGPPNNDIRAVIAQLTGSTMDEAHEMMRDVLRSGRVLKLQSQLSGLPDLRGDPRLSLTKLRLDGSTNFLGRMAGDAEYLLLIARATPAAAGASDSTVGLQLNLEV
jgi:hypothetical protein